MAHVSIEDLQQFLEQTKLDIAAVDEDLDATFSNEVFSRLAVSFDTTTWVDVDTTPELVKDIIAALMVAQIHSRTYSEESVGESWYAQELRNWAYGLLGEILAGTAILIEVHEGDPITLGDPLYFPTDAQESDGEGNEIKFRMGTKF